MSKAKEMIEFERTTRERAADPWWELDLKKKEDPLDAPSGHKCGGKDLTLREKARIDDYVRRRNAGLIGDEGYWKAGGFKVAGGQHELSKEAMKNYGFGIPKRAYRRVPHAYSTIQPTITHIPEELQDRDI